MKKWVVLGAVAAFAVLATGVTANAEMGVGVKWEGSGVTPDMVFPISLASGIIISPQLGFNMVDMDDGYSAHDLFGPVPGGLFLLEGFDLLDDPAITHIRFGVSVEKETAPGGTTALFGASAMVHMISLSDVQVGGEDVDSWMNMEFGLYIGGSASLTDGVDIVGAWGPTISMLGAVDAGDIELGESATNIGTSAHVMLRWWLWGE